MEKNLVKIHWIDRSSDCETCGYSTITKLVIEYNGKTFSDSSGGCFGNKYDQCQPHESMKAILELMGFEVDMKYEYFSDI